MRVTFFVANRDNRRITEASVNQSTVLFAERRTKQPIPPTAGRARDRERSPAPRPTRPSSIGNGSGERKAESPKAVAPTTAGPGYHLAPGKHTRESPPAQAIYQPVTMSSEAETQQQQPPQPAAEEERPSSPAAEASAADKKVIGKIAALPDK